MIEVVLNPLIDGAVLVFGSFVNNLGSRLTQHFIPSNFDKAQWANVEVNRKQLALKEQQFLVQMEEARAGRLQRLHEIEKTGEINDRNATKLRELDETLKRWPLAASPIDIFSASQARRGRSLNVLMLIVDTHDPAYYAGTEKGKAIWNTMELLNDGALDFTKKIVAGFGEDVLFYPEPPMKSSRLTGISLRSKLWNPLWTEPTVLIEINVRGATHLKLNVSHWGAAFEGASGESEPTDGAVSFPPVDIHLSALPEEDAVSRERALAFVLSGMVVAFGDAFRALHQPHVLEAPLFPSLLKDYPAGSPLREAIWEPLATPYLSTYDQVASHSPAIAAELAANAALSAHASGNMKFSGQLLDKALAVHGLANASEEAVTKALLRQRTGKTASRLENALITVRGWTPAALPSFEELMRNLRPTA